MAYVSDLTTDTVTLDDGQSLSGQSDYVTVDTGRADEVHIYVDGGSTGTAAASHDLAVDAYKAGSIDDWMRHVHKTGTTEFRHEVSSSSNQVRVDLTDASGGTGNSYRVAVEARVTGGE